MREVVGQHDEKSMRRVKYILRRPFRAILENVIFLSTMGCALILNFCHSANSVILHESTHNCNFSYVYNYAPSLCILHARCEGGVEYRGLVSLSSGLSSHLKVLFFKSSLNIISRLQGQQSVLDNNSFQTVQRLSQLWVGIDSPELNSHDHGTKFYYGSGEYVISGMEYLECYEEQSFARALVCDANNCDITSEVVQHLSDIRLLSVFLRNMNAQQLYLSMSLFFVTSMSVRYTLVETQTRMYKFTLSLHHAAKYNLSTLKLIAQHVLDCLVFVPVLAGMLFLLAEVFKNQITAFMILLYMWLCEVYVLASSKSEIGKNYFYGMSFIIFNACPLQYLSQPPGSAFDFFFTLSFSTLYVMIYIWNRYDLPSIR